MTYTKGGKKHRFSLKEKTSHKWRDIGLQIHLKKAQLDGFSTSAQGNNDLCWESVMDRWLSNAPKEYPADWEGLYELLEDMMLGEVAQQLREAVHLISVTT